jgi:CheY-like chemotaxis protein
MEAVGRLAGGVAHDFNNMLGVIIGHSELALLELSEPDHPLAAHLRQIRNAARRSAKLTRQLLGFARKQTVIPQDLDLNVTVAGMLKMLRPLLGEDVDFVWLPGAAHYQIKIDPTQIDQILANLCVNARDAITGVGKITIETDQVTFDKEYCAEHPGFIPGDFAMLAVSDNGHGMEKSVLDNIFEPFFTTKGKDKGTGLGLATIYGIIKQNNGFINVYSEPEHGTTFKIYFPLLASGQPTAAEKKSRALPQALGQETILLVEDESALLDMGRLMLESLGYMVLTAATPDEALRLSQSYTGRLHLLITDVIMPEMNGRELADRLLRLLPEVRLLFMSGYTGNAIAHHGILDEGVRFIQKPFSIDDLAAKVREALDA